MNTGRSHDKGFFRRPFPRSDASASSLKERARAGKLNKSCGSSVGTPFQAVSTRGIASPSHNNANPPISTVKELIKDPLSISTTTSQENEIESQTQSVRVAVRLRPLNPLEVLASKRSRPMTNTSPKSTKSDDAYDSFKAWNVERHDGKDILVQKGVARKIEGKNMFNFDGIFQENIGTAHVYENFAGPIVQAVLDGKHGTIFTYGTSGSGKTHSMQGDGKLGSLHKDGIIQLAVRDLFNHIRKDSGKREYVMRISFFEIYNEQVRDLLATSHQNIKTTPSSPRNQIPISPSSKYSDPAVVNVDQGKGIGVDSAKKQVSSVDDVLKLLYAGNKNRAVATTILNDASSRSHAIFRLTIESRPRGDKRHHASESEHVRRISALNFVDLAGSENTSKAATAGSRRRESGKINQSLLSLSQVIHALSLPPKKKPKFINYRNSKLTRILQPHLSGNAVLAVLCCATAAQANLEETRNTLKFGYNAKRIEMKPMVNEIIDDKALIQKLQNELKEAKKAIKTLQEKEDEAKAPSKKPTLPKIDTSFVTQDSSGPFSTETPGTESSFDYKEDRLEKAEREQAPNHSRVEPSPLASPALSQSSIPEKVSSPNNLSASSKMFAINAVLFDKHLRNCDQDSKAERSVGRDCNSTISDLSSARRPPTIQVIQDSPPSEVTIIRSPLSSVGEDVDINVRLTDAEERAKFLEEKLESADRLVELMTRDLRNARLCIHELVFRNVRLENQLAAATHGNGTPVPSTIDFTESKTGTEEGSHGLMIATERIGI